LRKHSLLHAYEVRPRKDHRGVDLISDALSFGRLWYGEPNAISNAVDYAKFRSRSDDAVILGHNSQSDRKVRSSRILAKNGARGRFPRSRRRRQKVIGGAHSSAGCSLCENAVRPPKEKLREN